MELESSVSYTDSYIQYLQKVFPDLAPENLPNVSKIFEETDWDEPQSALDLNNSAVVALAEAELTDDLTLRTAYLNLAMDALSDGASAHPLCAAHLAMLYVMLGKRSKALEVAFSAFVNSLQAVYASGALPEPGLVYVAPPLGIGKGDRTEHLALAVHIKDSYTQALLVLVEVLCRTQLAFYSPSGLRFLQLAVQLIPQSVSLNLKLGLSSLMNRQWEGLLYLQRARQLAPDNAAVVQALYLAYRDLNQVENASVWLQVARSQSQKNPGAIAWNWSTLEDTAPFTYLPFGEDLKLAVEPSFRSIVTNVILAEGDWFEDEIEFWRTQLQPGMTVIDVGANVGVYTFSAAQHVGPTGRVLAIEPFSGCVRCLQETRRVNQMDWVTVCPGAASDRNGKARLALQAASELNEVITDESQPGRSGPVEEIACFTLDHLIEQESIDRVDFLKIDAEGHELNVLQGSDRLLTECAPCILYENIAGSQGSNLPVAEFLLSRGYELFYYQPYLQDLLSVDPAKDLQGTLNIIALPSGHKLQF